jgi:hypothetical protein
MKQMKSKFLLLFSGCSLMLVFFVASSFSKNAMVIPTQDEIGKAVTDDRWDFTADYAMPSYGASRNIMGMYFVKCRKDSLIVSLPYYGKITSAAGATNENPLDFQSTEFSLTKEKRKKGGWFVTFKQPNSEVRTMTFTFYDNGSAQLNFVMTNRSGISFSGKVAAPK